MSSFTSLFFVVACVALLAGCDARQHRNRRNGHRSNRRNSNDASVALGSVSGSQVITLPVIHLSGPDVIIGFPDNCAEQDLELLGTELIVSNVDGIPPVDLVPENANDALSNVAIHCNSDEHFISRCLSGISVTSYQYCGGPISSPTTLPPPTPSTAAPTSTSNPTSNESSSSTSTSSEN